MNLTPALRKKLYVIAGFVGVALGAVTVGFASADAGTPTWLKVSLAVYAFVVGPSGFALSASNVPTTAP